MGELLHAGVHWSLINFALFVALLVFVLRKPVKEFWASRREQIRFALDESGRLKREAEERHEDLKKRLSRLETEARELVHSMEREGEAEKRRLMEEAERLASNVRQDTERILAQEIRKARETLKAQAVELAVELAEKTVRDHFKDTDQKKLSEEYLAGVEKGAA